MQTVLLVTVLGAALLSSGCGENKSETPAAAAPVAPPQSPQSPAQGTKPVSAASDDSFVASGPLIVEHQVEITAQRDGVVAQILAETGTKVKAGTVLARLDDRQITANLEAARAKSRGIENDLKNWQAEAEVMKADYARAQRLWNEKLIAEEQLQHAKYKVESEEWDIKRVSEMLNTSRQEERSLELEQEKTRISAPFDSLVARRYAREGQAVVRGDKLFWVTAEAPLLLRFTVPEKFLGRLKIRQELPLISPDVPQEKHMAKVVEVSPVVDPSSGTFDVLVELTGARGNLRPGMTASVRLDNPQ
jgi:RND family efflux transporter MFP subunit